MIKKLKRKIEARAIRRRRERIAHYNQLARFDLAEKYIRLNSIDNEYNFNSDLELSTNLINQGRSDEAETVLRRIISIYNLNPENTSFKGFNWKARMKMAQLEYGRLKIDEAIVHLKSIKSFSGFNDFYLTHEMLARMYKYRDNHEGAFSAYNKILSANYRHIERIFEPYFEVAKILFPDVSPEEILKKHLNLEPEYFSSMALAKYYLSILNIEKARAYADNVSIINPGYLTLMGEISLQQGDFDEAKSYLYRQWRQKPFDKRRIADLFWISVGSDKSKLANLLPKILIKMPQIKKKPTAYKKLAMLSGDVHSVLDSYQGTAATNALSQSLSEKYQSSLLVREFRDKSLLVLPLWGIGDEIIFATVYQDLHNLAVSNNIKLTIATEHRLVNLMKRSFPKIQFITVNRKHRGPHLNKVSEEEVLKNEILPNHNLYYSLDYATWKNIDHYEAIVAAPIAARDLRKSLSAFDQSNSHYLVPDPVIVDRLKARLDNLSSKPKIGISWRSSIGSQQRTLHYTKISQWAEIFKLSKYVDFVNLQYDNCEDEIEYVKSEFNVDIINFSDIDFFNDLDSVCGLISLMDMTIAPCTVMGDFSGALGVKTLYFVNSPEGKWRFDTNLNDLWFKSIQFVKPDEYGDNDSLLRNTAAEIKKHFSID